MANIIEILLAAKDQASASIQRVQGSLRGLNTVLGAFGGPAGLAAGGLASFSAGAAAAILNVKNLASEAERLSNMAQQTGVSTDAIQAIGAAYKRQGLSIADAAQALKFLNRSIADENPLLRQLGVTSKDVNTAFLQLADSPVTVAEALTVLGRAGNISLPVLRSGSVAIRHLGEESVRTGASLNVGAIKSLTELDDQFDRMGVQLGGLKNTIAINLAGPMTEAVKTVNELGIGFQTLALAALSAKLILAAPLMDKKEILAAAHEMIELGKQIKGLWAIVNAPPSPSAKSADPVVPGIGMTLEQMIATEQYMIMVEEFRRETGTQGFRANPKLKPDSMVDVPATVIDSKTRALMDFRAALADITDAGNVMSDTLHLAFGALETGFKGVFDSILQGGSGFAEAMRSLFRGMVDAIFVELSRLAAAAVFKLLLSFISGSPAGFIGPPAPAGTPGLPERAGLAIPERSGGNTYIINAIDARDVVMSLMSPGGSMRRANDRIAIAGAY